jgi:hypothetical protein
MPIQLSTPNPDFSPLLATGFRLDSVPDGTDSDPIDPPDNQGGGSTITQPPPPEEELTEEEAESE